MKVLGPDMALCKIGKPNPDEPEVETLDLSEEKAELEGHALCCAIPAHETCHPVDPGMPEQGKELGVFRFPNGPDHKQKAG